VGFFLRSANFLGHVGVDETKILERLEVSEFPVDGTFMNSETTDVPTRPGPRTRRRASILNQTSFAISLAAYIEKVTGTCPLCGYVKSVTGKRRKLTKLS
jgi:hypothetical protein